MSDSVKLKAEISARQVEFTRAINRHTQVQTQIARTKELLDVLEFTLALTDDLSREAASALTAAKNAFWDQQ